MSRKRKQGKKVVLIIVEGPSDEAVLGVIFSRVFDNLNEIVFRIVYGDLTTRSDTNPKNIKRKLGDIVNRYKNTNYLNNSDFEKVVFITDTDGCFCDDESVVEDDSNVTLIYSETQIICPDREQILARNHKKAELLNQISTMSTVAKSIPFETYYMSGNLDHVVHNRLNLEESDKERLSFLFARDYKANPDERYTVFEENGVAVIGTSAETWDFIKQGNRSLERHSNLINCFLDVEKSGSE